MDILGDPYLTGYEPLLNAAGETIGIWYVGYLADLQVLEQAIANYRLLDSGFLALLDDQGELRMQSQHLNAGEAAAVLSESTKG